MPQAFPVTRSWCAIVDFGCGNHHNGSLSLPNCQHRKISIESKKDASRFFLPEGSTFCSADPTGILWYLHWRGGSIGYGLSFSLSSL